MRLILIDGMVGVFRFFHSVAPMRNKMGGPINVLYGYCNSLLGMLKGFDRGHGPGTPTHFVAVFDHLRGVNFRKTIYAAYKADRPPRAVDMMEQIPLVKTALIDAFGVQVVSLPDVEADDVLATYARAFPGEVVVVTNDKDLMQLVSPTISLYDPIRRVAIDREAVLAKFGIDPWYMTDFQALVGDRVDNVPGVPGIGPKTAARMIAAHGDLDAVIAGEPERIGPYAVIARLSKELVTLYDKVDAPALTPWVRPAPLALGHSLRSLGLETLAREGDMS